MAQLPSCGCISPPWNLWLRLDLRRLPGRTDITSDGYRKRLCHLWKDRPSKGLASRFLLGTSAILSLKELQRSLDLSAVERSSETLRAEVWSEQ